MCERATERERARKKEGQRERENAFLSAGQNGSSVTERENASSPVTPTVTQCRVPFLKNSHLLQDQSGSERTDNVPHDCRCTGMSPSLYSPDSSYPTHHLLYPKHTTPIQLNQRETGVLQAAYCEGVWRKQQGLWTCSSNPQTICSPDRQRSESLRVESCAQEVAQALLIILPPEVVNAESVSFNMTHFH